MKTSRKRLRDKRCPKKFNVGIVTFVLFIIVDFGEADRSRRTFKLDNVENADCCYFDIQALIRIVVAMEGNFSGSLGGLELTRLQPATEFGAAGRTER
jgi:hypothetical protein